MKKTARSINPLDGLRLPGDTYAYGEDSALVLQERIYRDDWSTAQKEDMADRVEELASAEGWLQRVWKMKRALIAVRSAIVKAEEIFGQVRPSGPLRHGPGDALDQLRTAIPAFAHLVDRACEDTSQTLRAALFTDPNPESRERPYTHATRALRASAGWSNGRIAREELRQEGCIDPTEAAISQRSEAIKKFLQRKRTPEN